MRLEELETQISVMISAFHVKARKLSLVRDISSQYLIEDFGVIICAIDRKDYSIVDSAVEESFEGWRKVYIATTDDMNQKREELLWELMRSGYMKYVRFNYPHFFKNLIIMHDFGRKVIEKRLEVWGDKPKYKFMILDNKDARRLSSSYLLSTEPGFFDFMPEEE